MRQSTTSIFSLRYTSSKEHYSLNIPNRGTSVNSAPGCGSNVLDERDRRSLPKETLLYQILYEKSIICLWADGRPQAFIHALCRVGDPYHSDGKPVLTGQADRCGIGEHEIPLQRFA